VGCPMAARRRDRGGERMSSTTVYAAEVLDTIAERRNLEQFTGTPIFVHGGVDDELVGWLGCPLPTSGYPCEHMGMGDEGSTACWSATEINRLREENSKLRALLSDALIVMEFSGRQYLDEYLREEDGTTLIRELKSVGIEVK